MGIDITIGNFKDGRVVDESHPDAPVIQGSWMGPSINAFGGTIGTWHSFVRRVGLYNLVDCDGDGCEQQDCDHCWERGEYIIDEEMIAQIESAKGRFDKLHPEAVPRIRSHKVLHELVPTGEDELARYVDFDAAVLWWLSWWVKLAYARYEPAYIGVTY